MKSSQKINLFRIRDFATNFSTIFEFTIQNYSNILKGICYVIILGAAVAYFYADVDMNTKVTNIHEVLAIYTSWKFRLGLITSFLVCCH